MTQAEQKARETIEKFLILDNLNWEIIDRMNEPFRSVEINKRKGRALICVDEIIKALNDNIDYNKVKRIEWTYWNEVKTAIQTI